CGRSGAAAALADDPAPLALGRSAPHASFLARAQGVLQTGGAHAAPCTDLFRGQCVVVVIRVEDAGVEPTTSPQLAPFDVTQRHVRDPQSSRRAPQTLERPPVPRQRQSRALSVTPRRGRDRPNTWSAATS